MDLNGLDILVLTTVAGSAALGLKRGFVTEVLALFAWVAVVFATKAAHLPATKLLSGPVGTPSGAAVLAYVLIGGVTYVLGRMVARAIGARVKSSVLGPVDRALGFGFGALKGLILSSLAFLLVVLVFDTIGGGQRHRPAWIKDARTYPLMNATSNAIADFVARRRRGEPVFGPVDGAPSAAPSNGGTAA